MPQTSLFISALSSAQDRWQLLNEIVPDTRFVFSHLFYDPWEFIAYCHEEKISMVRGFSSLNLNVSQKLKSDFLLYKHLIVDNIMAIFSFMCFAF